MKNPIERLKSILLICLVISSIILTTNKWFNEKLWPEGYNFFSDAKNYFTNDKNNEESNYEITDDILNPSRIILNNSGNHVLHSSSSDVYFLLLPEIKELLEKLVSEGTFVQIDESEWNSALKSKSCYISYPVNYDSKFFFSKFSEIKDMPIKLVNEFMIIGDIRIPSVMYVYVKDASDDTIYKKRINYDSKEIPIQIDSSYSDSDEIFYYSYELNFDRDNRNSVDDVIVIDPDVLINISSKNLPLISEVNVFENISANTALCNKLLSAFGYNSSTIRKYIENDNSIVFVENYGSVKFHSNGTLDYKAVDNTKGIQLSSNSIFGCVNDCIAMVNEVSSSIGFDKKMHCVMSSDIKDFNSNTFTLTFDYYSDDNMIIIPSEIYGINHAVEVEVVSGKIVAYKQIFKRFKATENYISFNSAIDAIDKVRAMDISDFDRITDIFTAYTFDVNSRNWLPSWHIEDSDSEIFTVVTNEVNTNELE